MERHAAVASETDPEAGGQSSGEGSSREPTASLSGATAVQDRKGHAEQGLEDIVSSLFQSFVSTMDRDLKPYFEHLDTRVFLRRCARSVFPTTKYDDVLKGPDLYGPLVLVFTLSSCLHFAFKKADPAPLDRHLGTSLLVCFGSLVVGSLLVDVAWQYSAAMAKQSPAKYGLDRAACLVGYSFFGPSIVMLLDGRVWTAVFVLAAVLFELGSAMSFGTAVFKASQSQSHLMGAACAVLHMVWLYNLRAMLRTFDIVVDVAAG